MLSVTATFTAEPLEASLAFWGEELGLDLTPSFAPYNQVFQQLLDPASLIARSRVASVLLVRAEDWVRFDRAPSVAEGADVEARMERSLEELCAAIAAASPRLVAPLLVAMCPPSPGHSPLSPTTGATPPNPGASPLSPTMGAPPPNPGSLAAPGRAAFFDRLETRLAAAIAPLPRAHLLLRAELDALYPLPAGEVHDAHGDHVGHIPYTPSFFAAIGTLIARKLWSLQRPPRKVIAVDCDDTLWKGVVGELGPRGVEIDAPRRALQEALVGQKEAGMLIAIVSKNAADDALEVWKQRPEMPLRREDIVATRVNWRPKSENLRSIAGELGLGLDSFVFVDDSPIERAEVAARCPEVLVLDGFDGAAAMYWRHVWAFDRLRVTDEDRRRTALYQENAERERVRRDAPTFADFLEGLALDVRIAVPAEGNIARAAQLTQRTNQFNTTTLRRSEGEIDALLRGPGALVEIVDVGDRFGDYGTVGVMIGRPRGEALEVEAFLLSCRVLGRGVENRMLRRLGEAAQAAGLARVDVRFVPSRKNQPARDFFEAAVGATRVEEGDGAVYRVPAELAATLPSTPFVAAVASLGDVSGEREAPGVDAAAPSALMSKIARDLHDVGAIVSAIAARRRSAIAVQAPAEVADGDVAERSPVELRIAEIWTEVLGLDPIPEGEDFVALGGDSQGAAQVVSRLARAFQVRLPIDLLFDACTVSTLAVAVIEALAAEHGGHDDMASLLGGLEG